MGKKKGKYLEDIQDLVFGESINEKEYIYFILCSVTKTPNHWANRIKIGRSKKPKERLDTLRVGNPYMLRILYQFPLPEKNAAKIEHNLHQRFRLSRYSGEWFHPHDCIFKFMKEHKKAVKALRLKIKKTALETSKKVCEEKEQEWSLREHQKYVESDMHQEYLRNVEANETSITVYEVPVAVSKRYKIRKAVARKK